MDALTLDAGDAVFDFSSIDGPPPTGTRGHDAPPVVAEAVDPAGPAAMADAAVRMTFGPDGDQDYEAGFAAWACSIGIDVDEPEANDGYLAFAVSRICLDAASEAGEPCVRQSDDTGAIAVRGLAFEVLGSAGDDAARARGIRLLELAASKLDPVSMNALGVILMQGELGCAVDLDRGLGLVESAAARGLPRAWRNAAMARERGFGCGRNVGSALRLYKLALERGCDDARDDLCRLAEDATALAGGGPLLRSEGRVAVK